MWLSLLIALLVLGVAIFQAAQGAFSALLMCVLSILCAAAAFGAHDWLANTLVAPYFLPDYAHAIALAATFGVPLIGLRVLLDRFLQRACPLPGLVDKIGGGLCGLITGQVAVGVFAICLQLIPFGTSILGYSRFESTMPKPGGGASAVAVRGPERNLGLGLSPDRFTFALLNTLSRGVFAGSVNLSADYPDFVQAIAWNNTVPAELSRYAPPKSIAIQGDEPVDKLFSFTRGDERGSTPDIYAEIPAKPDKQLRMVRVQLKNEARDANKSHKFTLRQFRLVGRAQSGGALEQHFPIAVYQEDPRQPVNRYITTRKDHRAEHPVVDLPLTPREDNSVVEVVFELPKGFSPDFLEYKRSARAKVTFSQAKPNDGAAPAGQPPATPDTGSTAAGAPAGEPPATTGEAPSRGGRRRGSASETVPDSGQGGRVRTATAISGRSFFGDALPITLKAYRSLPNTDTGSEALKSGHLVAELAAQEQGKDQPVARFTVPRDKRLLHLSVKALHARSGLGKALSQAVNVAQNFVVTDANGRQYVLSGKYAIATVGGNDVMEIQYYPETEEGATGRAGGFQRIKEADLGDGDQLVLLFLVDPGAQVVSFSTGGAASRTDDLRAENLVAPK